MVSHFKLKWKWSRKERNKIKIKFIKKEKKKSGKHLTGPLGISLPKTHRLAHRLVWEEIDTLTKPFDVFLLTHVGMLLNIIIGLRSLEVLNLGGNIFNCSLTKCNGFGWINFGYMSKNVFKFWLVYFIFKLYIYIYIYIYIYNSEKI